MLATKALKAAILVIAAVSFACADPESAQPELSSHSYGLGSPDLWVQSVTSPASLLPNSSFSVPVTVCNAGAASGSASLRILRSSDTTITLSDTNIGSSTGVGTLAPGACGSTTATANISGNGTFYIGAYVDPTNALVESNETNNATAATHATVVGSKPDFIITSVSGPGQAAPGSTFSATATICNQGTVAGTAPVTLYLSADATITTADTQVGTLSAPPSLAPGACATLTGSATATSTSNTYWLGAIADRANTVNELLENNNAAAGNQIVVASKPDFIVTAVSGPPLAAPGSTFSATATMCNQGTASGTAPITIYLSADATITTGDFQAGVLPAPPSLAPGACATVTGNVTSSGTSGMYWLGAIANANNAVSEIFNNNNSKVGNQISVGNAPDYYVTAVSSATSALPGAQLLVVATVCNRGTQSGYPGVAIYFSADGTITTSDSFAGELSMMPYLPPGACDTISGAVPAPGILGTYFVGAIADYANGTAELWEDNNSKAGNQIAVGTGPDLVVSSVSSSASALPGAQLTVTATVCNQGTQGGSAQATIYFSADSTITTGDLQAGDLPLSSYLQPGDCDTGSMTVWVPPAGAYTVGAIADRYATLVELFEDNNATAGNRVAVGSGPDFVVTGVSSTMSSVPGGSVQVTATLCNQGTQGAGAPPVEVFFSTDATITAGDFLGSTLPPAGFLEAGACKTLAGSSPVPAASGTYYAGTITDRTGSVAELFEDNNATAGNKVGVGNLPDFVVTSVSTRASAISGNSVLVTATVCNQGTQGGSAPLDVFFSTDTYLSTNDYNVGGLPAPYLDAGACATVTGYVTAPWQNGTYYVGAISDGFGGVPELLEDNNSLLGNRIGIGDRPDFYVQSVSTAPSALSGAQMTVTATVCNQGTYPGYVDVGIFFSADATITSADYSAGLLPPIPYLRPGMCDLVSGTVPAPSTGTYWVGAIVDPFNYTLELFKDNNALAGNRVGVGNGPDLVVSSVSTVSSALPGTTVHVSATVCNQGTQGAPGSLVEIFFSTDATITGSDFFGGPFTSSPYLEKGACSALEGDVQLPSPVGTYYVGAIADRIGSVGELIEDNNATAGNRVGTGYGPDLVVTSVSAPPTASPSSSVQLSATVCNQGNDGAFVPPVEVYFSRDTTITGSDFFSSPLSPAGYLEAGACVTVTGTGPAPYPNPPSPDAIDTYYVGAIVDRPGFVLELIEDNNATAGNRVGVGNAPDFIVSSISTGPTALPGNQTVASVTVCNQGTQGGSGPLEIYFSTDTYISNNDYYSTNLPMPYLEAGACATLDEYVPTPWQYGTYYIGAVIDSYGGLIELFKDNNSKAGNRVGVGDRPDFYMKSVSTAPSAISGSQATVTATVCNQGTAPGWPMVDIFFSTDADITMTDFGVGTMPPINMLRPGTCEVVSGTFPTPPTGTWYVGAIADQFNYMIELFEDNNALAGNLVGVGDAPDFVISSVSTASSAQPGAQVTITSTVCNQGTQAGSTPVSFVFSTDDTISTTDFMAWLFPPGTSLQPGACETKTATVGTPGSGTYWVGAIADAYNSTPELLEGNNATAGNRLVVGNGPDFVVSSVSTAPTALPSSIATVTATVCNQGNQGGPAPMVEFFFSKDATITGSDIFGGPLYPAGYLEAGQCATVTGTGPTPYPHPAQMQTYYVGAIVDRMGSVPELREDNNATAGNQVGVGNAPDFIVSSISTGPTALPGNQTVASVTVCNQGTQGGSGPLEIYFSTDTYISSNDYYSTNLPMPYLEAGACATLDEYVPTPWQYGTYYIGAVIDSYGGLIELFKDNNSKAGNRVGVGDRPDFYMKSVSTAPSATSGSQMTVTATVCNQGTAPGWPMVDIFFSTDADITMMDFGVGTMPPINMLRPGTCEVVSGTFPTPPPGTWYVGAIADQFNYMMELFEDNNALAGNQVGVGNAPDYVISSVSTVSSAWPSAQVTITSTVCNQGTQGGDPWVELYFSTDATITSADQFVWSFPPSTYLQPGGCTTQSATLSAPMSGTYWVGAIADRNNYDPELLENNNATTGNQLVVGSGSDFVVSSVSTAPTALPGSIATVTATVCNQGNVGGPAPMAEFFFSKDATITGGDIFGGSLYPAGYLDPGACATVTGTGPIPYPHPAQMQTYYAGAIVDRMGSVPELREDNNATAGNQVGVGNAPDFIVSSISTGPTALPGNQTVASVTVCNQGTQGGSAPLEIYFSTDTYISSNDYYSTNLPMPYLEAGACATLDEYVPTPWQYGTYYIGAVIDSFGGMIELFKDNNSKAGNRVGVGDRPDFYMKSVSTAPSATPGSQAAVTATVCNQGTAPGWPMVDIFFSTDADITMMDFGVGTMPPINMLRPGACEVVSGTFPTPPQGTWYVGAIADTFNYMIELYEDNNALAGNQVGVGNRPDYVISSVSTASSAWPGAQVTITATVCNQGTQGGGPSVELYFSTDATITGTDQLVWSFPPSTYLEPGGCTTQSAMTTAPPSGMYWVGAIADRFNYDTELLENNNAATGNQLAVGNGSDFVVSSVSTAPTALPGSIATVTATVCNQGTQGGPAPMAEFFFSKDATITGGDIFGGPLSPAGYLDAGACATVTGTGPTPYPHPAQMQTYYAGAIVDRMGIAPELREDNNATAGNRVGVGNAPDFIVSSISTGPTASQGNQTVASVTVCNQGTQGGSAPLEIYFSTDTYISSNDYYSTNLPMPYLEAGACATLDEYVPTPWQYGTYYIGAVIDSFGGMIELFKDNNSNAGNRVGVGDRPDFYMKSVSTAPGATPGSQATVTATVCNQGTAPGWPMVDIFFSTDANVTMTDFGVGTMPPINMLRPGACEVVSGTFPTPPPGTWYVGAIADTFNYMVELFEDNNALAGNRVGVGNAPDFVVSQVTTAPSALPGAQVAVSVTVCNQGTQGGSSAVDLYLSTDATITGTDQLVWGFPPGSSLQPGECSTQNANAPAPSSGSWYVGAIADSINSTVELLEDNNAAAGTQFAVGNGPDFVVSSVSTAPTAVPSAIATVTVTVCNQGTQGGPAPMVEFFFSKDATITGGDIFGGPLSPAGFLAPGACATVTGTGPTPYPHPAQMQTYYVGAIVDRMGITPELREDNNAKAGNQVGVGNAPDFIVSSISTGGPTANSGSQTQVTVTVCNQGTQAGSAPLEIYFSTDTYVSSNDYYSTNLPMPSLNAGACTTITENVPTPWQEGTYYVGAVVDSFGGMIELFKDNNSKAGNRIGVGSKPDLIVTSVTGPASVASWAPFTATATVCNQGTTWSDAGRLDVVLSVDSTITSLDFYAGALPPTGLLAPGGCTTVSGQVNASGPGTYTLGAIADGANVYSELFEDNNTAAGGTPLVVGP